MHPFIPYAIGPPHAHLWRRDRDTDPCAYLPICLSACLPALTNGLCFRGIFFVSGLIFLFVRCDPIDDMLDGASASAITPATGAPSALSRNTAQPTVAYAQMLGPTTDLKSPFVQLPYPAVSDSVISDSRSSAQQGQGSTAAVGVGGAPYPTYTPAPTITAVGGGVGPVAHIAQMDAPVTYSV
jgi:hypothetical protein